jgi:hypothetical protein
MARMTTSVTPMCEPARLAGLYKVVIEQGLGVTAHVADDDRALMFTYDDIVFVLRNTAEDKPGLLDVAVYLPNDEDDVIKKEACRQAALSVPCLKAWVDSDGDIVLNLQSLTGPIGMMPPLGAVKELLPQALQMLRYATVQVCENIALAGIVRASEGPDQPAENLGHSDSAA